MRTTDPYADLLYRRLLHALQEPPPHAHRPPSASGPSMLPPPAPPEAAEPMQQRLQGLLAALGLTPRQVEVARLRVVGLAPAEIAERLGTTTRRVAKIMEEVRRAMGDEPPRAKTGRGQRPAAHGGAARAGGTRRRWG